MSIVLLIGERASFVTSLLLAMALFLTSAFNILPDSSEAIPFFSYIFGLSLLIMVLLTICLCYTFSVFYGTSSLTKLPLWMRVYILERLAPYLGIDMRHQRAKWRVLLDEMGQLIDHEMNFSQHKIHKNELRWAGSKLKRKCGGIQTDNKNIFQPENLKNKTNSLENVKNNVNLQSLLMTEKQLYEISIQLSKLLNKIEKCEEKKDCQTDWQNVALALDTLFFYIFSFAFSTVFLSCVLKLYKIYG